MKKSIVIIICVVCILMAISAGYMIRTRGSVHIKSESDYVADKAVYFLQKDLQWGNDKLGTSSFTMADSGCLTACIASVLNMQNITIPEIHKLTAQKTITPGILNQYFSDQGVYDSEGNIQWAALENALGVEIVGRQAGDLPSGELDTLLSKGIYPIVYVRVNGWGSFHFVLITGSMGGKFLCMDPLNKKQTAVPLSRYGGRIYAVRYMTVKG